MFAALYWRRGGLTQGVGCECFQTKKRGKKYYFCLGGRAWQNVGIPRSSIDGMRDFNIIAGFVCAGTGFRFFHGTTGYRIQDSHSSRDTGMRDTGYRILHGTTGYGISHFTRDHGIRDTGFGIFTNPRGYLYHPPVTDNICGPSIIHSEGFK